MPHETTIGGTARRERGEMSWLFGDDEIKAMSTTKTTINHKIIANYLITSWAKGKFASQNTLTANDLAWNMARMKKPANQTPRPMELTRIADGNARNRGCLLNEFMNSRDLTLR